MPYSRRVFNQKSTELIVGIEKSCDYTGATAQPGYSYGCRKSSFTGTGSDNEKAGCCCFYLLNSVGVNVEASA